MVELNAAQIIITARQTKYYLAISAAEVAFVSKTKLLSDDEKLIWLNIATKSALDPTFSCFLTYRQIGEMVNKKPDTVYRAVSALKEKGFLDAQYDKNIHANLFSLKLPQEGLQAVMAAPTRGSSEKKYPEPVNIQTEKNTYPSIKLFNTPPDKNPIPLGNLSDTPPDKNPALLIYINNNNNNKKHNHDAHSDFSPVDNPVPETDVQDADALICDFTKIMQEKYQDLPVFKRSQAALSHFTDVQKRAINERQLELAAIAEGKKIQEAQAQAQQFNEQLAQAKPVTASPSAKLPNGKLVEFEFDNERFIIDESVKDKILSQIPDLYNQNKILGEAGKKSLVNLLKEIFYFVAKAGSKTLDTCQLKRFYIARKLCLKGAWERPNGLVRQASINREQQWQQAKIAENKFAKAFTKEFMQNVA